MTFPATRMRRLRRTPALREMAAETRLSPDDFIMPYFVRHGTGIRTEIASMPPLEGLGPLPGLRAFLGGSI